jgi:hypothetical protein
MIRGRPGTCGICGRADVVHYDGAPHKNHVKSGRHQAALALRADSRSSTAPPAVDAAAPRVDATAPAVEVRGAAS